MTTEQPQIDLDLEVTLTPTRVIPWHEDHDTLVSIAYTAVDNGELTSANDVLSFFEKPWHFPELYSLWCEKHGD